MPVFADRYGLELTTTSRETADAYSDGIDRTLSGNDGAETRLAEALAIDETFAMAQIAMARQQQFLGDFAAAGRYKTRALELAGTATRRERQHIAAMVTAIDGDGPAAIAQIREQIAEFPRDAYLLNQANGPFGLIGFGGGICRHAELFDLLDSVASAYGEDWWFLSAYAFAHNELEHFELARKLADRALENNPRSGHGAHTMAHCDFETGQNAGGASFLNGWLPPYPRTAVLHSHLTWHLALFELAEGNTERVNALYNDVLRPAAALGTPIIVLADAAALLWREDLLEIERPADSRTELSDFSTKSFPKPGITFADMHCALAYAAAGDHAALDALAGGLRERLAQGKLPAGEVAVVVTAAVGAFADGDYARSAELLEPFLPEVVRVGGSNAQRQVVEDTYIVACLRSGRLERAAEVLRTRLARRPSRIDEGWLATTSQN